MIFISRAPQALGKSAITFLAECGVLRPVVMLLDKLEHNEIEDYKSFALTLIRSAGFEHSQIVFPAASDIKTTWDSVIQSIISEDKAINLEETP